MAQFGEHSPFRALARGVQLSSSHLRHLFKAETAVTPTQYLKSLRMRQAKKMMGEGCFSVKEVMTRVGLSDKSHFERDFKKVFGLTPAQYKALCARSHLVKKRRLENVKQNGHQIANSALENALHPLAEGSNLRTEPTSLDDGETIVNHEIPLSLERSLTMEKETMMEVTEPQQFNELFNELFEELSVTELEDRLELVTRCSCRVSPT